MTRLKDRTTPAQQRRRAARIARRKARPAPDLTVRIPPPQEPEGTLNPLATLMASLLARPRTRGIKGVRA